MTNHNAYHVLTDEEAADIALAMNALEIKVIALCSKQESWGYARLAERTSSTYAEIREVGHHLRRMKLATVQPVRLGREFNGSAIFINDRGEAVKRAAAALERIRAKKALAGRTGRR